MGSGGKKERASVITWWGGPQHKYKILSDNIIHETVDRTREHN